MRLCMTMQEGQAGCHHMLPIAARASGSPSVLPDGTHREECLVQRWAGANVHLFGCHHLPSQHSLVHTCTVAGGMRAASREGSGVAAQHGREWLLPFPLFHVSWPRPDELERNGSRGHASMAALSLRNWASRPNMHGGQYWRTLIYI